MTHMMRPRMERWAITLAAIIIALPAAFVAGVAGAAAYQSMRGPPLGGGEGVQGDAYAAFFIGGPIGVILGSAFVGWLAHWLAQRANGVAIASFLGVLAVGSAVALFLLDSI